MERGTPTLALPRMKALLKTEELAQLLVCIATLVMHAVPWWTYVLLAFGPDISMLGYLAGPRRGAYTYNLFHHKGIALLVAGLGLGAAYFNWGLGANAQVLLIAGILLYGHASLDRLLGFGLKYGDAFQHTHLGWTGKPRDTAGH
jgi:hypothetical protein